MTVADAPPGVDMWRWWVDSAACAGTDTDAFYPAKGGGHDYALRVCRSCPVRLECAREQLGRDSNHMHGLWGGLTPPQARALKARIAGHTEEVITDLITAEFDRVDEEHRHATLTGRNLE